ncbi:GNAT family N-acetyltransferase [Hyalangium rubrum]|uniref:GNAT family N-acetyltransferase n=1 Tax=Hyalangium rubrum TaxID=3103134 RepID=A0ABU5HG15_9BACT|nr:GNAT family N-acetyltransferase [Hyalangium sp. s54d21]MDY7232418.1 GNAT family N-acetyltransferase [Hyalangium sp. s54d21]
MLHWQWKKFQELTVDELYGVLALRSQVFVVEQKSIYLDADGYDRGSYHLLGQSTEAPEPSVAAYLRVLPPGLKYAEASLGRVVTASSVRRYGYGKVLLEKGISFIEANYPNTPIRIGAQHYLKRFYEGFGFRQVSDVYDEDGIPHIEMLR